MPYATLADAQDLYGAAYVLESADRDDDGSVDTTAVTDALAQASSEMDTYIGAVYDLPLATTPTILVRFYIDIGIYQLSAAAGVYTEEKRQRYDDAIAWLKNLAKGIVSLGIEDEPPSKTGTVTVNSGTRIFTRTKMKGIL